MAQKHLILIHGRSTKPNEVEKRRLVMTSLKSGLGHVDPAVIEKIESGEVKCTFIYYGDICNDILVTANPSNATGMEFVDGHYYEKSGSYDADLATLLARDPATFTAENYAALLAEVKDKEFVDDAARLLSPFLNAFGLTNRAILKFLPDLAQYLTSRVVGSRIRQRLQARLYAALHAGDDVALVSHSMGCMVSYDVLWKFSRMSEYEEIRDRKVSLWLTLGNPLGEIAVQKELYDYHEPIDGKYPANILSWVNVSAEDDFVASDTSIADDFREMKRLGLIGSIEDAEPIFNFWVGNGTSNPHKFFGYLNHPVVARRIAGWMRQ